MTTYPSRFCQLVFFAQKGWDVPSQINDRAAKSSHFMSIRFGYFPVKSKLCYNDDDDDNNNDDDDDDNDATMTTTIVYNMFE